MGYCPYNLGMHAARWMVVLTLVSALTVSGCALMLGNRHGCLCGTTACTAENPPREVKRLSTAKPEERAPIVFDFSIEIPEAAPLIDDGNSQIRLLSPDQCESFAAEQSPLARLLEASVHNQACAEVHSPIHLALSAQAAHERNESAGEALTAYYRLALVYLQNGLLQRAEAELIRWENVLRHLEDAGLAGSSGQSRIHQRRYELMANRAQMEYSQRVLTTQLREILNLDPTQEGPIWTAFQMTPSLASDGLESEIEIAWRHRGDLQALEHLQCLLPEDLLRMSPGWMAGTSPLPAISRIAGLRPWHLIFCKHRSALAMEYAKLQSQLAELIDAKRRAIAVEVEEIWHSLEKRQQLIGVKQEALKVLDTDWETRVAGKDFRPLTMDDETEYFRNRIDLISDLVRERIELEIDLVRLKRAQGTLSQ